MNQRYIGTKVVYGEPMTLGAYNQLRGWALPENEAATTEGYLVEYADGGAPNVEGRAGYVSWSPKDVFERSYRVAVGMDFSMALRAVLSGLTIKRVGWTFSTVSLHREMLVLFRDGDEPRTFLPTHAELLATDWITC
jgi:hypothetical protein